MLSGKPVIMHTLERIEKIDSIKEVIVVCLENYISYLEDYIVKYNLKKSYKIVSGGRSRQESVLNGLKNVQCKAVVIHEAARPFVLKKDFEKIINHEFENVTFGIKIPYTVLKNKKQLIANILDRDTLVNIQLPQKFNVEKLLDAHYKSRKNSKKKFYEDVSLFFYYTKNEVYILEGQDYNIKLTTNFDLSIAEKIYKEYMVNDL